MKVRNYVAKHAQRSGAGKHKRKDKAMSYRNQEDWIHVDDHYNETQYMEDQIKDLEQANKEMKEDEIFILSEIMFIRDHYSDYRDVSEELDRIINMHDASVRHKAARLLLSQYPNRHWGEEVCQLGS